MSEGIATSYSKIIKCNSTRKVPIGEVRSAVMAGPDGYTSMNAKYRGLVKPDVVFFGERLPERFIELGVQFTRFTRTKVQILTQKRYAASWHPAALSY